MSGLPRPFARASVNRRPSKPSNSCKDEDAASPGLTSLHRTGSPSPRPGSCPSAARPSCSSRPPTQRPRPETRSIIIRR